MWSEGQGYEGQGYEGASLLVGSNVSGAGVKGQRRGKHNGDDAGVDQWERGSKWKEIGSPDYSRNNFLQS